MSNLIQDVQNGLSRPLSREMPIGQILLVFILFLVVAYIVFDTLKLLSQFSKSAIEAASEAVS